MRNLFCICFLVTSFNFYFAQDPYFICFQRALLYNNPAFAGSSGQLRVQTAANYLWPGVGGYFNSFASVDAYVGRGSGVGLSYNYQDEYSFLERRDIGIFYSRRIEFFKNNKLILQPGIRISLLTTDINWEKLKFQSQADSITGFGNGWQPGLSRKSNLGLDAGLLLYMKNYYLGISVNHINGGDEAMLAGAGKIYQRYNIHFAFLLPITDDFNIIPSMQISKQKYSGFASFGSTFIYKKIAAGITYNTSNSISFNVGYQSKIIKTGVSHTVFWTGIPYANSYGAFEANISLLLLKPINEKQFLDFGGF